MKVLKLGNYIFVIYALYQYLEPHEKFTTKLPTPLPLTHGVMSSSSTSSSADYREKRTPPPGKRTGAAGPPVIGAIEAFPPLPVTRETQYRETSSSPAMPEKEKEKEKQDVPMSEKSSEKTRQDSAGTGSSSSNAFIVKSEDDKSTGNESADPKPENRYTASVKKISAPINADYNQDLIDFEKKHPHKKHRKELNEDAAGAQEPPFWLLFFFGTRSVCVYCVIFFWNNNTVCFFEFCCLFVVCTI